MALLTAQSVPVTGLGATYTAVNASDTITADKHLILHVKNAGAGASVATVAVPGTTFGQNNPDVAVSVPAGGDRFIFLVDPHLLRDPATGLITVSYDVTTSVTAALLKVVP